MRAGAQALARRGAFGFAVAGCGERWLAPLADGHAPTLELSQQTAARAASSDWLEPCDDRMRMRLPNGRTLELDTRLGCACLEGPEPLSEDMLVHPYLGFAASLASRLLGREVLHAGALVVGDGGWLLCAGPAGGKSTLLAALANAGAQVLADDIAVIDNGRIHRGPRCIDLRADPDPGRTTCQRVRRDTRWRQSLEAAPATVRLCGVVHLRFGHELAVESVPAAYRLEMIAAHRVITQIPADPHHTLALAALPTLELQRPRRLCLLQDTAELLTAHLTDQFGG